MGNGPIIECIALKNTFEGFVSVLFGFGVTKIHSQFVAKPTSCKPSSKKSEPENKLSFRSEDHCNIQSCSGLKPKF